MPVHCIVTPALNTLVAIYTTGRGAALLFSIFFCEQHNSHCLASAAWWLQICQTKYKPKKIQAVKISHM